VERAAREPALSSLAAPGRESRLVEVAHAAESEMALHLADVIFRRTGLGTLGHPGRACLERCAAVMASRLDWDAARIAREIDLVEATFRMQPDAPIRGRRSGPFHGDADAKADRPVARRRIDVCRLEASEVTRSGSA
jgi:hypothetical protein